MDPERHPFANSNVRLAIGLSGAITILVVAFFFLPPGPIRWALIGMAVLDAVATPHILKMAVESNEPENEQAW
jgi:hypothetical protein